MSLLRKFNTFKNLLFDPDMRFLYLADHGFYNHVSDEKYLKRKYKSLVHKELNLDYPKTFSEKIQWLKLHDRREIYTKWVDKYEAKEIVSKLLGPDYIVPTLGVWNDFNSIDFDKLPKQFVLKCTHDSGGLVICKDKKHFDIDNARKIINKSMRKNFYYVGREWAYKNVKPRIIAEQFIEDSLAKEKGLNDNDIDGLVDYKFYCFNGEPRFLYVSFANMKDGIKNDLLSFFDMSWNPSPFYRNDHMPLPFIPEKPRNFEEMKRVVRSIAKDIPFVRVDLYNINNKVLFSEFTLSPGSGFGPFSPDEWESRIGDWIDISKV